MTLPSKELLSAVFDEYIVEVYEASGNIYYHSSEDEISREKDRKINIYELAHKIKEWALKQGYRIASQLIERGMTIDIGMDGFAVVHTCNREVNKEREDTEPEAVFAAGEWILNQQNIASIK